MIKAKECIYINEPKESIKRNCSIRIIRNLAKDGTNSNAFTQLYREIDSLNIPVIDINKEKDKAIWKNYVVALKKLVKQKEQVWKILKISNPYINEGKNFIDIYINEKDLAHQFEKEIKNYFNIKELEDYRVDEDRAFIEFSSYRELSEDEQEKLNDLAREYFYNISDDSPMHSISGELAFKYTDETSKDEIQNELKSNLYDKYEIETDIDENGYLNISENDLRFILKEIEDNFNYVLELKQDNHVSLKVDVGTAAITTEVVQQIRSKLDEQGLHKANVQVVNEKQQVVVDVSCFLKSDFFNEFGFFLKERITRFGTNKKYNLTNIDECKIVGSEYQTSNILNKEKSTKFLDKIQYSNDDPTFRQLPTRYIFSLYQKRDIEKLRDFKIQTDEKDKTDFDIKRSVLTVTVNDNLEFSTHIDRIKTLFPNVTLEDKVYKPTFFLQFKTDLENQRRKIIEKILNEIRQSEKGRVKYDVLKNYKRVLFSYDFNTEERRDDFRQIVCKICDPYNRLLHCSFETDLGRTIYEFNKNETLELEKEKEVARNLRQATFIFLTPEQQKKLSAAVKEKGDDANFNEGTQIGTLFRKEREKLIFRIFDKFDDLLNAKEVDRLGLEEIRKGYIKPIFPGELTNIGRMIKAMKKVTEPSNWVGYPANKNLSNFLFDPSTARQSSEDIEEETRKIITNLNEPLLGGNQNNWRLLQNRYLLKI